MKVLLLASNIAETPYAVYPLGMSMIAGALVDAGHRVVQHDFLCLDKCVDSIVAVVEKEMPDVIGVSIRNIDNVNIVNEQRFIDIVKKIVTAIKTKFDMPIVLGGTGFSILPERILEEVGGDYGVVGEGERLMVEFVNNVEKGIFPEERCLRSSSYLTATSIPLTQYDPDLLKFYLQRGHVGSVQTKRGCVHSCVYCSYPVLEGKEFRPRNPKHVVDDIESLINDHGAQYVFFTDSVFNDDQKLYLDVIAEMKNRKIVIPWTAFFKPKGLCDADVKLMKETGLCAAEMGADAATDRTLQSLGKQFLFEDVRSTNELFVSNGISTAHFYMFGGPGETEETVAEGIDNLISMNTTVSFIFMGIRILPNTGLVKIARAENVISSDENFLEPVYYISPAVDKVWLEKRLTDAFERVRYCVFPPDAMDSSLQFLHKMGLSGSMFDMLLKKRKKGRSRDVV